MAEVPFPQGEYSEDGAAGKGQNDPREGEFTARRNYGGADRRAYPLSPRQNPYLNHSTNHDTPRHFPHALVLALPSQAKPLKVFLLASQRGTSFCCPVRWEMDRVAGQQNPAPPWEKHSRPYANASHIMTK